MTVLFYICHNLFDFNCTSFSYLIAITIKTILYSCGGFISTKRQVEDNNIVINESHVDTCNDKIFVYIYLP